MKKVLYLILALTSNYPAFCQNQITLSGYGESFKDNDTVSVSVYRQNVFSIDPRLARKHQVVIKDHRFFLKLDSIRDVETISLSTAKNPEFDFTKYLIMPGDDVCITLKKNGVEISGKQSNFFSMQEKIRKIESTGKIPHFKPGNLNRFLRVVDSVCKEQQRLLFSNKSQLTEEEYKMLEDDIVATPRYRVLNAMCYLLDPSDTDTRVKDFYLAFRSRQAPYNSRGFVSYLGIEYLFNQYKIDSCLLLGKSFNIQSFLDYARINLHGSIRERLLVYTLMGVTELSGNIRETLESLARDTKNPAIREIISEYIANVIDGSAVYNFVLPDTKGKNVKLSDFKGSPVVIDFWFTGCGACRKTAPILKAVENNFKGKKVVFISISIDKNLAIWKKSVESGLYTSHEINNLNAGTTNQGVLAINRLKVAGYPTILIVDKKGKINNVKINPQIDQGKSLIHQIASLL